MICFLTGRPDRPEAEHPTLNPDNRFVEMLKQFFPRPCRALQIASDPDSFERTDFYAGILKACFEDCGFVFQRYETLDGRNRSDAASLVRSANLLILSGGHVPTQNRFFQQIGLRGLLDDYAGVIIGISAGSMNSAEIVYAQPELDGEALDPAYRRFLPGLGLTKTMLLPHYQEVKDSVLDGLRLFEDITFADSMGKTFYAIPDGSYLLIRDGREELRGEAYRIRDGVFTRVSEPGGVLHL